MRARRHSQWHELTLDQIQSGQTVRVRGIRGGWGCSQRLNQMGIHAGDPITVKRNVRWGGPILVQVHGSEIALGRGMARHIMVAAQNDPQQDG